MTSKKRNGLVGLFILFMMLFNVPFISTPSGNKGGIPNLMIYFAIIWIFLIFFMGIVFSNKKNKR